MVRYEDWKAWNGRYNCLPYIASHDLAGAHIPGWDKLWKEAGEAAVVLESGKAGRYTFVGAEPVEWMSGGLTGGERRRVAASRTGEDIVEPVDGAPLEVLRRWMAEFSAPRAEALPKFGGGIAGYLAYDVARTIERLPGTAADDSPIPDYFFFRLEKLWIIDHVEEKLHCVVYDVRPAEAPPYGEEELRTHYASAQAKAEDMAAAWSRWMEAAEPEENALAAERVELDIDVERMDGLALSLPKKEFMRAVERVRDYIAAGDVFQVNISVRQSRPLRASPEQVYEALRRLNPSPYMAFLRLPGGARIASASPELLVRLEGRRLSTRPIAGTRPRGRDEGEDGALREELLLSEKERAEHIMLVDLERNDLGKISTFGTVRVKELMAVEHYSHVMHIVSEVEGELASGRDAFDCIAAVFPGGTITGAPKIRTMEIIEELEPTRRGAYTGAIGWIDYAGNMELNITIRTLVYADGTAYVQSGAGIVIDSDPEKEFVESLNKAKALWKAAELAERAGSEDRSGAKKSRGEKEAFGK
ncbi:anthranilate synthase component I family protein [Paenibacillus sp.]|uniref:anthranilate synthase component I family protein n=1 Tax=Paenibacillus sp. TaxID=58172 RepID=UPI002D66D2A8|nr:anthranilate synthase component I family protein [Paenibacillus sp.]HZG55781.1 anthranilate synthase component I family protein [Paenibacillus sp.]